MKLFYAIILIAMNSALGFCQEAEFYLKQATFKFDKVKEGEVVAHTFIVTNTGKTPLIISDFKVACTCTKVILPKNPISPGKTGEIIVSFDSEGKAFYQDRIIFLSTNTKKKTEKIRIKIYVIPKEEG